MEIKGQANIWAMGIGWNRAYLRSGRVITFNSVHIDNLTFVGGSSGTHLPGTKVDPGRLCVRMSASIQIKGRLPSSGSSVCAIPSPLMPCRPDLFLPPEIANNSFYAIVATPYVTASALLSLLCRPLTI